MVYLDSSATTRVLDEAVSACIYAMEHEYGNPSSLHKMGFEAEKLIISAKNALAQALFCKAEEVLFLSGATEANNLALFGAANAQKRQGNRIITTAVEHPSVLEPLKVLEKQGFEVIYLSPDENGCYTADMFEEAVDEKTVLVSSMWVNNENGIVLPIEEIGKAVKRKNPRTIYHVDGVQGFLKLPLRLKSEEIDLMSLSGHKVNAPKGVGVLYAKGKTRLVPQMYGGGQQGGVRSGTESVPLISSFGAAVLAQKEDCFKKAQEYRDLKAYLKESASACEGICFFEDIYDKCDFAPHILTLSLKGVKSEVLLHFLEAKGIMVSSGSACAKGKKSHVLSQFPFWRDRIDSSIRISFGRETSKEDLDRLSSALTEADKCLTKIK